jgi:hypothetical protein
VATRLAQEPGVLGFSGSSFFASLSYLSGELDLEYLPPFLRLLRLKFLVSDPIGEGGGDEVEEIASFFSSSAAGSIWPSEANPPNSMVEQFDFMVSLVVRCVAEQAEDT